MSAPKRIEIAAPATGEDEWQAVREPLVQGWLTQGPKVAAFERAFAARHRARHAVATTSATTALHLALLALGVEPGDEVVVPAFTWVATANVVLYCGARLVFADVDRTTFNLDPVDLARRLSPRTRAVIPVHLFGNPADVDALRAVLPSGVRVIEDAACATGGRYRGRDVGTLGDAAAFSFHPRKSITTGEGGMLLTADDEVAERARTLRNHGGSAPEESRGRAPRPYDLPEFNLLGFNYRMTDLQGAVGLVQLGKLDGFLEERRRWAAWYREALADLPWLRCPEEPGEGSLHSWQAFVTYVDPATAPCSRDAIMDLLDAAGVATRPGTHAVHALGHYRRLLGTTADDFPGARDCERNSMAIPLHNRMTEDDYRTVSAALHAIEQRAR